jgi:hypothetical protein
MDNLYGIIAGGVVVVLFAAWGIWLARQKIAERKTEASSHYESGIGTQGGGPPHDFTR